MQERVRELENERVRESEIVREQVSRIYILKELANCWLDIILYLENTH